MDLDRSDPRSEHAVKYLMEEIKAVMEAGGFTVSDEIAESAARTVL